jgi:hypothetical protein
MNEMEYKRRFQEELLKLLIRKYENSVSFRSGEPARQRPQIAINKSPFHEDYEDEMDYRKKEWIHDVVIMLSEQGILSHAWMKFQEGRQLSKIYLELDRITDAYALVGVTPRDEKMERLLSVLAPLREHPWPWVSMWASSILQGLTERRAVGLDLDDHEGYQQLVMVLQELPGYDEDIPKRILSQRLFHDSKKFERDVERRLVHLIRTQADMDDLSDSEVLESVGIIDNPHNVLVAGPLVIQLGSGAEVSLEGFPGGVGLSHETIRELEVVHTQVARIILIENLTSWHQWVAERRGEPEIVIYTGGFPNRSVQALLKKMNGLAPCYHWGDIDVGGIRIFEYVREHFIPDLQPLGMDEETYHRCCHNGMAFDQSYQRKIQRMLMDNRFARWHELLRLMETSGIRIEQESITQLPVPVYH